MFILNFDIHISDFILCNLHSQPEGMDVPALPLVHQNYEI